MTLSRRTFVTAAGGAAVWAAAGRRLLAAPAASVPSLAAPPSGGTMLVVLQLTGGNDGLNTVVPFRNDVYARSRPTLRLGADRVLPFTDELGFHPDMRGFRRLYDEGHLALVQGVGYPNPNGGHAEAMRDWLSAHPHEPPCQTGWLGRAIDAASGAAPAVFVGDIPQPFSLNAERALVPSIAQPNDLMLPARAHRASSPSDTTAGGADLRAFVRDTERAARAMSERIERAPRGSVSYPPFQFAARLRAIADLMRAEAGFRIYAVELGGVEPGGFDNHANQAANHAALLRQLSESLTAFIADLAADKLLDRVLVMTLSEFGRTVAENGRRGTDHGSAAPVFLAGGRLAGGVIGEHPSLTELESNGAKFHTDFRRLYATALGWLSLPSAPVLGDGFEAVAAIRA